MTIPSSPELEEATRNIVREGKRTGKLRHATFSFAMMLSLTLVFSELTPRIIRSKVEEFFGLNPGTLDSKEYKIALKEVASDEALVCSLLHQSIIDSDTLLSSAQIVNQKANSPREQSRLRRNASLTRRMTWSRRNRPRCRNTSPLQVFRSQRQASNRQ